jgi:hypothetical protein
MPIDPLDFDASNTPLGPSEPGIAATSDTPENAAPAPPPLPSIWKKVAAFLAVASVICGIGWIKSAEDFAASSTELRYLQHKFSKSLAAGLISRIDLTNTADGARDLGNGPTDEFDADSIRYITYRLTGTNPFWGGEDFEGQIDIKFISPNGTIDRGHNSPPGFTFSLPVRIGADEKTWEAESSWGNKDKNHFAKGIWHIQFFYDGRLMANKPFTVR